MQREATQSSLTSTFDFLCLCAYFVCLLPLCPCLCDRFARGVPVFLTSSSGSSVRAGALRQVSPAKVVSSYLCCWVLHSFSCLSARSLLIGCRCESLPLACPCLRFLARCNALQCNAPVFRLPSSLCLCRCFVSVHWKRCYKMPRFPPLL